MHRCDRLVQAKALQLRNQAVRDCKKAWREQDDVEINKRQEALHKDLKKIGCDVELNNDVLRVGKPWRAVQVPFEKKGVPPTLPVLSEQTDPKKKKPNRYMEVELTPHGLKQFEEQLTDKVGRHQMTLAEKTRKLDYAIDVYNKEITAPKRRKRITMQVGASIRIAEREKAYEALLGEKTEFSRVIFDAYIDDCFNGEVPESLLRAEPSPAHVSHDLADMKTSPNTMQEIEESYREILIKELEKYTSEASEKRSLNKKQKVSLYGNLKKEGFEELIRQAETMTLRMLLQSFSQWGEGFRDRKENISAFLLKKAMLGFDKSGSKMKKEIVEEKVKQYLDKLEIPALFNMLKNREQCAPNEERFYSYLVDIIVIGKILAAHKSQTLRVTAGPPTKPTAKDAIRLALENGPIY